MCGLAQMAAKGILPPTLKMILKTFYPLTVHPLPIRYVVYFFLFLSLVSLIADGPHYYHPACGHKGSSHLSPVHALQFFLSRCKFSTLTTRQSMVEFHLLTFPRFLLRKKEHKSYFGKNRSHDFRTSRYADYLLDHSGDEAGQENIRGTSTKFQREHEKKRTKIKEQ